MAIVLFILLFVFLFSNIPVYISMALSSVLYMFTFTPEIPAEIIPQRMFSGVDTFTLIAIPCFIFAANVMKTGGLSKRIINLANAMVGHFPGGLANATIIACMFFGALSGSAPATVAAIGAVTYPALVAENYKDSFATGLITSSAAVALIIPPSIGMIVYGTVASVSVGELFLAGVIPGILFGIVFMIYTYFHSKKHGIMGNERVTGKRLWEVIKDAGWSLGVPVIVIGGIYGGIFTPTEASAVAAIYAIIISMFIYRELSFKELIDVAFESAIGVAQIMILIAGASVFAWLLTRLQLPAAIGETILQISSSRFGVLILMNIILLISGMFIDPTSTTLIFAPLFIPLANQLGIDLIHLGIIIVVNSAIGMFTPPFGFNLFVAAGVTNRSINQMMPGVMPFVFLSIITLLLVTFIPKIALFLPGLM